MAAAVETLVSGTRYLSINVTGEFSVADETDTIIVNRSDLTGPDGVNVPTYISVQEMTWSIGAGFDFVKLEFDDGTDDMIDLYHNQGYMDYRPYGGKKMAAAPASAAEGDILLSTSGGAAGDSYSLLIHLKLKK